MALNFKEKITMETQLDVWYGLDKQKNKIAITEDQLLWYCSNSEDFKHVAEKIENGDEFLEMPDGAILGNTIKTVLEKISWEQAQELIGFAKLQNKKNGFSDFEVK